MNGSKVVPRIAYDFFPQELVVTHADYRALEEHRASVEFLLKIAREAHEATLQELASIKARAAEDAERLDWCEANPEHPNMPYFEAGYWWMPYLNKGYAGLGGGVSAAAFGTLREAIDTARKEPK